METVNIDNMIFHDLRKYYMNGYLPKKDLLFFNSGKSGVVFTHAANHYITVEELFKAQEYLEIETGFPVIYFEDRRSKSRQSQEARLDKTARN